jgi:hypothetical protein
MNSNRSKTESQRGDFYLQDVCCRSCGVPQSIAPELVGWVDDKSGPCYWIRQPETADELDRAINVLHTQELGCHRYSGTDPAILKRCPPEDCDSPAPRDGVESPVHFGAVRNPCEVFAFCFRSQGWVCHKTMAQSRAIKIFKMTSARPLYRYGVNRDVVTPPNDLVARRMREPVRQ